MKKLFKISMLIAVLGIVLLGCKKDDNKFTPPNWLQGKWGAAGVTLVEATSDDIIISGVPLSTTFASKSYKWETYKDNGTFYELKLSLKTNSNDYGFYSFKKGDGTSIQWGSAANSTNVEDYVTLDKIN